MKVVYLPLDERPCNLQYPLRLADATDIELSVPSVQILGEKKRPADVDRIRTWLLEETKDATHLILSLDMLVYGGIVPSRLHHLTKEQSHKGLEVIKELKNRNKKLIVYAFNLIMRVPNYNSSDEEPDYYEVYGERISTYGKLLDKNSKGEITNEEINKLQQLNEEIPKEIINDFTGRRSINASINKYAIDLVNQDFIDFLIIPLDDNAEYGFSSMEQSKLLSKVESQNLMDRVAVYPGADEVGCTLFAKVFCEAHHYTPTIFLRYSSTKGPFIIPKYEDRSLQESIKSHITAMGGIVVDHSSDADAALLIHSPAVSQSGVAEPNLAFHERHKSYFTEVNYREFVEAIKYYVNKGKTVGLADVATCNGSDLTLMSMLKKQGLIEQIDAYAGWNTSGNSLGTVLAHTIIESYYKQKHPHHRKREQKSREFYYARLVEDWGYQAIVRKQVASNDVPRLGCNYFNISNQLDVVEGLIKAQLQLFIKENLSEISEGKITIHRVYSPWKRMFEVGFDLSFHLN